MKTRRLLRALPYLAFLALLFLPALAVARPGGGQSYSGGSHSSSSGSGSGGGGGCIFLVFQLWLELVFRHPMIGIPLTIVVIAAFISYQKRKGAASSQSWNSAPASTPAAYQAPASRSSRDLDDIRQLDPEFSVVLFQDFAYALYAKAHEDRFNPRDLESLSPYLGQEVRDQLAQRQPVGAPVSGVVIGAMRVVGLSIPGATPATAGTPQPKAMVLLEFEANMTVGAAGAERTQYVRERWQLARDANVQSKPPEQVGTFHCPNCGAPFGPEGGDRCQYCGQVVSGGRFDWSVTSIDLLELEERPPALTSDVQEMGTDLPTILHPQLNTRWAELVRDDPAVTQDALAARFNLIYDELNAAWTGGDLATARPYVSDGLFDYLQYWVTAYRTQGLRNVLEGMRIVQWKAAKIIRDRHFDSLTIRIWGTGHDYTVRQGTNEVVSGNPRSDRLYSEYWTLIRGAGVKGAPSSEKTCPNCGAPLNVNMAGECEHCGAKITSGAFDWVLSTIEQDDSYSG